MKKVNGIGQAKERAGHLYRWESMSKSRVKKKPGGGPGHIQTLLIFMHPCDV